MKKLMLVLALMAVVGACTKKQEETAPPEAAPAATEVAPEATPEATPGM